MKIEFTLNGAKARWDAAADDSLFAMLRALGMKSVKCGCETSNCGLCTVWLDGTPVLSCSVLAARVQGRSVTTLEGLQAEAACFGAYLADEGAEQCGFCAPGFIMTVLAMERKLKNPTHEDIRAYLAGNLCRCSGYMGQMRAIEKYLNRAKEERA